MHLYLLDEVCFLKYYSFPWLSVGTNESNVVVLDNASSGVNAVFRSLLFGKPLDPWVEKKCFSVTSKRKRPPGDNILGPNNTIAELSFVYPMVHSVIRYVTDRYGASYITIPLPFPLSNSTVCASVNA